MHTTLLQWDVIQKIVLNTLLVSIPEELFLVMFTLILLGEFDYWKDPECKKLIHRYDYGRILIPTITVALLSNILRYTGWDIGFFSLIPLAVFYILIIFTNDIFGDASALKWMGKAFVFLILGFIIVGLSEFIYVPFILYGTGKTLQEINNNILSNFLVPLPSRVIQYSILLYFISRKRTLLRGNVFKHVFESPLLSVLNCMIVIFDLLFLFFSYKLIIYDRILSSISHISQFITIVGVIIFPIINMLGLIWSLYYVKNGELLDKKIASDKLNNLLKIIESYTNIENYDNIKWKLNEIGMGIEEIAASLYKDDEKKIMKDKREVINR